MAGTRLRERIAKPGVKYQWLLRGMSPMALLLHHDLTHRVGASHYIEAGGESGYIAV